MKFTAEGHYRTDFFYLFEEKIEADNIDEAFKKMDKIVTQSITVKETSFIIINEDTTIENYYFSVKYISVLGHMKLLIKKTIPINKIKKTKFPSS